MSGVDGKAARREVWSTYWAQGALHSCVGSFDERYSGAIGAFWDDIVATMAAGTRVLDLATGNGALPMRVWKHHGNRVHVDAVDLAALAPPWYQPADHESIAFHAGVLMEALPFADGGHDWVVSQYGFEYADRDAALSECLRVLAPQGRLAFVMHHVDSVLVAVGREELANIECLLAADGLVQAASIPTWPPTPMRCAPAPATTRRWPASPAPLPRLACRMRWSRDDSESMACCPARGRPVRRPPWRRCTVTGTCCAAPR